MKGKYYLMRRNGQNHFEFGSNASRECSEITSLGAGQNGGGHKKF